MYILTLILGCIEVALTVWLIILTIDGSLWGLLGLILYLAWSYIYGEANFWKLFLTLVSGGIIAVIFLEYGLGWALIAFIVEVIVFEFFPKER